MKIVGKEKLEIKALNDGSIEIGYNFGNNKNSLKQSGITFLVT